MEWSFIRIRKGMIFNKDCDKRYVVVNYTASYVYLIKLSNSCSPVRFPKIISYDTLNERYTAE